MSIRCVSGCPMQATIMDASRVTLQGEGISQQVAINKASFFRVNTQAAGEADLVVRVTGTSDVATHLLGTTVLPHHDIEEFSIFIF